MADEPKQEAATSNKSSFIDSIVPFFVGHRSEIVMVLAGLAAGVRIAFPDNPTVERFVVALDAALLPLGLGFLSARIQRNYIDPNPPLSNQPFTKS